MSRRTFRATALSVMSFLVAGRIAQPAQPRGRAAELVELRGLPVSSMPKELVSRSSELLEAPCGKACFEVADALGLM